jgi:hypothetical protein
VVVVGAASDFLGEEMEKMAAVAAAPAVALTAAMTARVALDMVDVWPVGSWRRPPPMG